MNKVFAISRYAQKNLHQLQYENSLKANNTKFKKLTLRLKQTVEKSWDINLPVLSYAKASSFTRQLGYHRSTENTQYEMQAPFLLSVAIELRPK